MRIHTEPLGSQKIFGRLKAIVEPNSSNESGMKLNCSLVPRLLHSRTENWTCACGESVVFYLTWVPPIARVEQHTQRLTTGKGGKVAANLLHVSSYWGLNIIHTKHWTLSWLNNVQKVSFLFQSYFDYVMLMWKICQALYTCAICIPREPGNEAS